MPLSEVNIVALTPLRWSELPSTMSFSKAHDLHRRTGEPTFAEMAGRQAVGSGRWVASNK